MNNSVKVKDMALSATTSRVVPESAVSNKPGVAGCLVDQEAETYSNREEATEAGVTSTKYIARDMNGKYKVMIGLSYVEAELI